jgi:hypothetical protein
MNTHFLRGVVIAFLALLPFLPSAAEASTTTTATAAPAPSDPLRKGDDHPTDDSLSQRVVLYEEEPGYGFTNRGTGNPQGRRAIGSVVWNTEQPWPGFGKPAEAAVRADINIPERKMEMTWWLRRSAVLGSSTSHIIEFLFKLPPDFTDGGILKVPGFWMKAGERTQAIPLIGQAAKGFTSGDFLIGLSATAADMERNLQLLKDRPWFEIPIVYTSNRRAVLDIEKGTTGEHAFQRAFAAWNE